MSANAEIPPSATAGSIRRLLLEVFRDRPLPMILLIVSGLIGYSRAGVYVLATGGFVQALVDRDRDRTIVWIGVYLGATLIELFYWPTRNFLLDDVLDHSIHRIQQRVLHHASHVPLVAFENNRFFSRLQRANDNLGSQLHQTVFTCLSVLETFVFIVSIAVPLWLIDPWIVLILPFAQVTSVIAEYRTANVFHEVRTKHAPDDQFQNRLEQVLTDRNAAAELRLFGNGRDVVDRWRASREKRATGMMGAERIKRRTSFIGDTGIMVIYASVFALVVARLINGDLSVGDWATVSLGLAWLSGLGYPTAQIARTLKESSLFVGDLFLFENEFEQRWANQTLDPQPTSAPAKSAGMAIKAENITFRYPDAPDNPVIEDISLDLAPGERVALVGVNGAGKSTLVRLLTGLYLPDSGTVTLDGHLTNDDASQTPQSQIGAVFQDFVPWQMTARDNIGLGNPARLADDPTLIAAANQAGIGDLIEALPEGLDTWLGREFGERDLSGGQWQRIAIARAFVRDARFLVLDEPTAALDPLAEQQIFERFAELAAGKTALMISHRLGPARFADRILVMADGKIIESGTHQDLMTANGTYAEMFKSQAEWYNQP